MNRLDYSPAVRELLAELAANCASVLSQTVITEAAGGVDVAKRVQGGEAVDIRGPVKCGRPGTRCRPRGGRYGEHLAVEKLAPLMTIHQTGRPGWVNTKDITEDRRVSQAALAQAQELLTSGEFDLFICDEINGAVGFGLIDVEQVLELINRKPEKTELVLTGRNAHDRVIEVADLVTEMREVKHYYNAGVPARTGIEM